jgi:hypothetical protein
VPKTAFVFTPTRTVTAVNVTGSTIVITATGVIATDSVAYTAPGIPAGGALDQEGNALASFSGVLA